MNDNISNAPAYIRLYRKLREDIVSGVYAFGDRLPSKRLLSDENGVSVITAEHAYALLLEEGYVESRQRSGYFVIFRMEEGFAGTGERTHIDEREEMPPSAEAETETQFPFSVLARTMRSVLSDYGEILLSRSPNEGTLFLRTEISRYLARSRGIAVPPERIIIGSGSEYLYNLIIGVLGRDKTYGIEDPSYAIIEKTYRLSGVDLELLPLGKDGLDSGALRSCRADVLHLTP